MRLSDLSEPRLVGGGASFEWLHRSLQHEIGNAAGFTHFAPVQGEKYSARVLATFEFSESASWPKPMSGRDMARELIRLIPEARFDPEEYPGAKGWVIMQTTLGGKAVTLVRTSYCAGAV